MRYNNVYTCTQSTNLITSNLSFFHAAMGRQSLETLPAPMYNNEVGKVGRKQVKRVRDKGREREDGIGSNKGQSDR